MNKIIVIGGGPAGMFAAIAAAETGSQVILLEKNEKLGKKLFITGKGRCNITNAGDMDCLLYTSHRDVQQLRLRQQLQRQQHRQVAQAMLRSKQVQQEKYLRSSLLLAHL